MNDRENRREVTMRGVCVRGMRFVRMCRMRMSFVHPISLTMRVGGLVRRLVGNDYIHLGAGNATARHFAHFQARAHVQCGNRLLKMSEGDSGVNQCAEQHVATYAGKAIQIANTHRKRF